MATRQKLIEVEEAPPMSDDDIERIADRLSLHDEPAGIETEEEINEDLEALYAELEITGDIVAPRLYVSKLNYDGLGNEARVWDGEPMAFSLERVAKMHGSGQYRMKVYRRMPNGKMALLTNKVKGYKLTREEEARLSLPAVSPIPSGGLTIGDVQRIMLETLQPLVANIRPPAEQINPMAMMKDLAVIMRDMQPPQPAQSNGFSQMKDAIELMSMMRDMQDPIERGVNASTSDVLVKLVDKFGPALAGLALANQGGMPGAQAMMQQAPALAAPHIQQLAQTEQVQPAPESEQDMNALQMAKLKAGLSFLLQMASVNADPVTYAGMIADNVPPDELERLLTAPAGPTAALATIDARVTQHAAWFDSVFAELKIIMTPDDAPQTEGGI